jgi:hypothetical protein
MKPRRFGHRTQWRLSSPCSLGTAHRERERARAKPGVGANVWYVVVQFTLEQLFRGNPKPPNWSTVKFTVADEPSGPEQMTLAQKPPHVTPDDVTIEPLAPAGARPTACGALVAAATIGTG